MKISTKPLTTTLTTFCAEIGKTDIWTDFIVFVFVSLSFCKSELQCLNKLNFMIPTEMFLIISWWNILNSKKLQATLLIYKIQQLDSTRQKIEVWTRPKRSDVLDVSLSLTSETSVLSLLYKVNLLEAVVWNPATITVITLSSTYKKFDVNQIISPKSSKVGVKWCLETKRACYTW